MTSIRTTALAAIVAVVGATTAQAQPGDDLPILVDKYYAIKNPAGPVTAKVPEALQKGPELKAQRKFNPEDFNPQEVVPGF